MVHNLLGLVSKGNRAKDWRCETLPTSCTVLFGANLGGLYTWMYLEPSSGWCWRYRPILFGIEVVSCPLANLCKTQYNRYKLVLRCYAIDRRSENTSPIPLIDTPRYHRCRCGARHNLHPRTYRARTRGGFRLPHRRSDTNPSRWKRSEHAAAMLRLAKHPVISINGNVACIGTRSTHRIGDKS